ncbi:MAG: hypothetical protein ACI9ON_000936 [Limisphaerales bacterium]
MFYGHTLTQMGILAINKNTASSDPRFNLPPRA